MNEECFLFLKEAWVSGSGGVGTVSKNQMKVIFWIYLGVFNYFFI
jgi:hypothetical protein